MIQDPSKSLEAAFAQVAYELPGWWITAGLCSLTGHASIGPDYNSPEHGERLRREFPEDLFDGFHSDLAPGDGLHRTCEAILDCLAQAKERIATLKRMRAEVHRP